jgi:hypothetical protein
MATTLTRIEYLSNGVRDTAGAVVASPKLRFYQPGTLIEETVYQDAAGATPFTQPVTGNAGGQAAVYTLNPVRLIAKNSAETTTYFDDVVNLTRMDAGYYTNASGTEQTQEAFNNSLATSFGATGGQIKVTSTATAQNINEYLASLCVPVTQFGAVGDGTTDDRAAIQATIDYVESRGGGVVYLPESTYKITSALTIDTVGVSMVGAGRTSIIKNFSTTGHALTVDVGSAVDCKLYLRNFAITADTTSSGTGVRVLNGDSLAIHNVSVALHRTGFDCSAVTGARLDHCIVVSTDDNASAAGVKPGPRSRLTGCEISSATDNGSGISSSAADVRVLDCYIDDYTVGISNSGARMAVRGAHISGPGTGVSSSGSTCIFEDCYVTGASTGFNLSGSVSVVRSCYVTGASTGVTVGASNISVRDCHLVSCTTGVAVNAHDGCAVTGCSGTGNTLDLSVNTAATNFTEQNAGFATITAGSGMTSSQFPARMRLNSTIGLTASDAFTPVIGANTMNVFGGGYTGGAQTVTVALPVTTNAQPNDLLFMSFHRYGHATSLTITLNAGYKGCTGQNQATTQAAAAGRHCHYCFRWTGTEFRLVYGIVDHNF